MPFATALSNVSIRTKILGAFLAIGLVTGGLGATALTLFADFNAAVTEITGNTMQAIGQLADMRATVLTFRLAANRELALIGDRDINDDFAATYDGLIAKYKEIESKNAPTVATDRERGGLYEAVKVSTAAFFEAGKHLHGLAAAQKIQEAQSFLTTTLAPAGERASAALTADLEFNKSHADALAQQVITSYHSGRIAVSGLLALAAAVAVVATLFLARSIGRPINVLTHVMGRLAANDTAIEVPAVERGDEIGRMARAILVFKDALIASNRAADDKRVDDGQVQQRSERIETLTRGFEAQSSELVGEVAAAASNVQATARGLSGNAEQTTTRAETVPPRRARQLQRPDRRRGGRGTVRLDRRDLAPGRCSRPDRRARPSRRRERTDATVQRARRAAPRRSATSSS